MTLDKLIRAVMKYMDEHGMLSDLKKKYRALPKKSPIKKNGKSDQ